MAILGVTTPASRSMRTPTMVPTNPKPAGTVQRIGQRSSAAGVDSEREADLSCGADWGDRGAGTDDALLMARRGDGSVLFARWNHARARRTSALRDSRPFELRCHSGCARCRIDLIDRANQANCTLDREQRQHAAGTPLVRPRTAVLSAATDVGGSGEATDDTPMGDDRASANQRGRGYTDASCERCKMRRGKLHAEG